MNYPLLVCTLSPMGTSPQLTVRGRNKKTLSLQDSVFDIMPEPGMQMRQRFRSSADFCGTSPQCPRMSLPHCNQRISSCFRHRGHTGSPPRPCLQSLLESASWTAGCRRDGSSRGSDLPLRGAVPGGTQTSSRGCGSFPSQRMYFRQTAFLPHPGKG